ncbi:MAG: hypothetical protein N2039_06290 [Gemmataceae bacterium]|nr:hypothetical protein [Gemmataceae bacterium]
MQAQLNVKAARSKAKIREVIADKGYHSAATLELMQAFGWRTYIPEPKRKHRSRWTDKPAAYRAAVYANRRRVCGQRGRRLQRLRSEMTERSFAHVCETGGSRRTWLRGLETVSKRYVIQAAARNLGLLLRRLFGIGTPRSLQGLAGLFWLLYFAIHKPWGRWTAHGIAGTKIRPHLRDRLAGAEFRQAAARMATKSTGC